MIGTDTQTHESPGFNYHLLRSALDSFKKNLAQLSPEEYRQVIRKASKTLDIESLVLASPEAGGVVVSGQQLTQSVEEIAGRYESREDFIRDLQANGLDEDSLRRALYRELLFNGIMQKVAAKSAAISDLDVLLFYEMHPKRFETPEQRVVRHILITINPDYPENSYPNARARIEDIRRKLAGRINRFHDFAKRYSECPTAMEEGKLGKVTRGQLYPALDAALFQMTENSISQVLESEVGFHLLFCEKILPSKRIRFAKVKRRIHEILQERRRRNCQKAWLAELKQMSQTKGQ